MIYCISGLGANERVFKYLDFGEYSYKYIKWVTPLKNEELADYCKRLLYQIDLTKNVILVGVSFGGIVAQEISKIVKVDKIIIISSVKSTKEFGWQLDLVRKLNLYKLTPSKFLKWSNKLTGDFYFSVKTKNESVLLKQIIMDTDRFFMKWAIDAIMKWNGSTNNINLLHIHGDTDRIFPIERMENYIRIVDGGHFMIVNRAQEISEIIMNEIKS